MSREPIVMSWSGGKDSAMALWELLKSGVYDVRYLLTTVTRDYGRVSMHGVREGLLRRQAEMLGVPLDVAYLSKRSSNEEYESVMREKLERYKSLGISLVAFGDLFLEDIRRYREERMSRVGMSCRFPLWGEPTAELARRFISSGFRAVLCTVDPKALDCGFAGREFSGEFLRDIPENVDPCGENGEFHTFVYDGPIFRERIGIRVGETVLRDSFCFADVLAA